MFKNLDKYFKKYKINKIIIGYPTLPSGKKSKTTLMIEDLEIIIKKRYSLPIKRIEENFSTKKAHEILIYSGIKRKKRKNLKDKIAAQIILTNYLKTL
jgi:putative Holliday junction resolvase